MVSYENNNNGDLNDKLSRIIELEEEAKEKIFDRKTKESETDIKEDKNIDITDMEILKAIKERISQIDKNNTAVNNNKNVVTEENNKYDVKIEGLKGVEDNILAFKKTENNDSVVNVENIKEMNWSSTGRISPELQKQHNINEFVLEENSLEENMKTIKHMPYEFKMTQNNETFITIENKIEKDFKTDEVINSEFKKTENNSLFVAKENKEQKDVKIPENTFTEFIKAGKEDYIVDVKNNAEMDSKAVRVVNNKNKYKTGKEVLKKMVKIDKGKEITNTEENSYKQKVIVNDNEQNGINISCKDRLKMSSKPKKEIKEMGFKKKIKEAKNGKLIKTGREPNSNKIEDKREIESSKNMDNVNNVCIKEANNYSNLNNIDIIEEIKNLSATDLKISTNNEIIQNEIKNLKQKNNDMDKQHYMNNETKHSNETINESGDRIKSKKNLEKNKINSKPFINAEENIQNLFFEDENENRLKASFVENTEEQAYRKNYFTSIKIEKNIIGTRRGKRKQTKDDIKLISNDTNLDEMQYEQSKNKRSKKTDNKVNDKPIKSGVDHNTTMIINKTADENNLFVGTKEPIENLTLIKEELENKIKIYKKILADKNGINYKSYYIKINGVLVNHDHKDVMKHCNNAIKSYENEIRKLNDYILELNENEKFLKHT